jgi:hypothetical protein
MGKMLALASSAAAQTVNVMNVSHPLTALEPGDMIGNMITGAAPSSPITANVNGTMYSVGSTDGSGNAMINSYVPSVTSATSYTEYWYVNGVLLTPVNPDPTIFLYAPALPTITEYPLNTVSNPPVPSVYSFTCGQTAESDQITGDATAWVISPVVYYSTTSQVSESVVETQAGYWSGLGGGPDLSYGSSNIGILIQDGSTNRNANGEAFAYGGQCSPCLGYTNNCNGQCTSATWTLGVMINLNSTEISVTASGNGASDADIATLTVAHELGHALRLTHSNVGTGGCSWAESLMFPSATVLWECGVTTPTSLDSSALSGVYPSSSLTSCEPAENYCTYESCGI